MMKKHVLTFLFFAILLCVSLPLYSSASESTDSNRIVIKVGYDSNFGILDNSESLDSRGFGYDILTRAEHYSNFEFEYIEYDYWSALNALERGEIDLMGIMLESESYSTLYSYVPKVLGTTQLILASESDHPYYDSPRSIDQKTVASFHNNPYEKYLNAYCNEHNISITYIRDNIDDYLSLDADLFLVTTLNQKASDLRMVMNLEVFDMHFITNKERPELANSIADAINLSVSADGTFLEELQLKYYGSKNLTRRYLTTAEIELLQSKPLVCGYIDHHQPIQFTNEYGNPDGISIEVMESLSQKYGFAIDYVPYNHDMPEESHEDFDILVSATGDLEHEMEFYIPSEPFLELPMMLFAHNDTIDKIVSKQHSSTLGILNYITIDRSDIEERYPNNTVISYDRFDQLFDDYLNGELDGFFATDSGVEYAHTILGTKDYAIHSTDLVLPLRVFVSRDSEYLTEYVGAFNVMFEHLERNSIDEILSMQSVTFLPEYSAASFVRENMHILISVVFLIILIIIGIIFYTQHKRRKDIMNIINYDTLTNLLSLYNFSQCATECLLTASPNDYEVISIDIDSFHTINTIYSQEKGDLVIQAVAAALTQGYHDHYALITRVIADHFLIFHKISDGVSTKEICETHVHTAIKKIMGEKYNISMSSGSCIIENTSTRIDEIIDCAVAARLKGKQKYKITYHEYDERIRREHQMMTSIVYRMKDALANRQFKVVYQPKIHFDSLKIGGAEALVRWHTGDENGIIPPSVFINIFESNGFIVNLDLYVFEEVCRFITTHDSTCSIPLISINVSTITLFDDKFPSEYLNILSKYNLSPSKVELEVTESAMAIEQDLLIQKMKEIKALGLYMSIDDFGAGESSLNRLSNIVADTLKLDKAFFDYNISDDRGTIIVENVIKLAKQLNMKVVSEGVETLEQAKWLRNLKCDYAQGYFFERPMSEEDFIALLTLNKTYTLS